jgi:hypothetical protein
MLRRSSTVEMGKLKLLVAGNEDLFLLKAITEREGDIHDMTALARTQGFNWTIVFDELLNQEEITEKQYCLDILESVEVVENLTGIRAPVRNRLINHCLDQAIIKIADRIESFSARQIRNLVNYPEYRIESRIRRLVKQGELFSLSDGRYSKC